MQNLAADLWVSKPKYMYFFKYLKIIFKQKTPLVIKCCQTFFK